ncbi:MAG: hypothetical protein V1663_02705 [archaeon]
MKKNIFGLILLFLLLSIVTVYAYQSSYIDNMMNNNGVNSNMMNNGMMNIWIICMNL